MKSVAIPVTDYYNVEVTIYCTGLLRILSLSLSFWALSLSVSDMICHFTFFSSWCLNTHKKKWSPITHLP